MPHQNEAKWDEKLREKLATEPYASMPQDGAHDAQIARFLNQEMVPGPYKDVHSGNILKWLAIHRRLGALKASAHPAARDLLVLLENVSVIELSIPETHDAFDALVGELVAAQEAFQAALEQQREKARQELITAGKWIPPTGEPLPDPDGPGMWQVDKDEIMGMCAVSVPWWKSVGAGAPLTRHDIQRAMFDQRKKPE